MYYLLVFNEYWADEHKVPALACMNETDYNDWLNRSMVEDNYESDEIFNQETVKFNEKYDAYNKYVSFLSDFYHKNGRWPSVNDLEVLGVKRVDYVIEDERPTRYSSLIYDNNGYNGDGFGDNFSDCLTGKDFVDQGYVTVTEVDESFYNTFESAKLSDLSLCNIFQICNLF